ncbi:MAG: amidohydrolase [Taibaiella sp.]|nr:amidohydrolase [Taibaiella sp.]
MPGKEKLVTRVIALEEAFLHPKLRALYEPSYVKQLDLIKDRLTDVGPKRIKRMDAAGIDLQILSHVSPGVQNLDCDTAISLSKEINDWLFEIIRHYPTRFAAFAMLPTQSPHEAAKELERTVTKYGFKGALINGHTHGIYLDDDSFSPLLECAQALDVPIYIHPTDPPQAITDIYYKDYPAMVTGGWGWQVETGTHLLRLMCGGIFDRYPRLKIIIGHMGELIPYNLQRINKALTLGNWLIAGQSKAVGTGTQKAMQKSVFYYMRNNVFITTSGVFDHAALNCALAELGIDNILFSVDDPFGDNFEAMEFLNTAQLSKNDKEKLAHRNAERILKLSSNIYSSNESNSLIFPRLKSSIFTFKAKVKSKIGRMVLSFLVK